MMKQGSGAIVCMSSGAREGTPWTAHHVGGAACSAAKAGIHGFIRDAAMELAEHGIRINAVVPGPIETERPAAMFQELRETSDYNPHKLVPMRRIGQPREIADAVLFLASDEASYITGTTLSVAGGRQAHVIHNACVAREKPGLPDWRVPDLGDTPELMPSQKLRRFATAIARSGARAASGPRKGFVSPNPGSRTSCASSASPTSRPQNGC